MQSQGTEHLNVFFIHLRSEFDAFFHGLRQEEVEPNAEVFAQHGIFPAGTDQGRPVVFHRAVHRAAFGYAAADNALDAILSHEVQRPLGAALNGLPALHG